MLIADEFALNCCGSIETLIDACSLTYKCHSVIHATYRHWVSLHYGWLGTRSEGVGQTALATVLAIFVESHEDACTTFGSGAFAAETLDFAVRIHLVILEDGHLDLLTLVLDLLGSVVRLLLALLGTTTKAEHQVKGGLLLYVVVAERATVFELFAGKDQTLLVGGNPFLVLDLGLDIIDSVRGLDLKGDGLAGEGLYENLHIVRCSRLSNELNGGVVDKSKVQLL